MQDTTNAVVEYYVSSLVHHKEADPEGLLAYILEDRTSVQNYFFELWFAMSGGRPEDRGSAEARALRVQAALLVDRLEEEILHRRS